MCLYTSRVSFFMSSVTIVFGNMIMLNSGSKSCHTTINSSSPFVYLIRPGTKCAKINLFGINLNELDVQSQQMVSMMNTFPQ